MTCQKTPFTICRVTLGLGLIALMALVLPACSRETDRKPAAEQDQAAAAADSNTVASNNLPYLYSSDDGQFQVYWPSGCDRLRIRGNEPEVFEGEGSPQTVMLCLTTCDQFGEEGEGCSVAAIFESHDRDGGPAGQYQVVARVRNALTAYSVAVVRETQIRKEFEDGLVAEGLDVTGTGADGKGQFWVRGLLVGPDIYVLTAWSMKDNLWGNPEYIKFFNGFLPFAK